MVALEIKKTFSETEMTLLIKRILDCIQTAGYSIVKKREIAHLIIASRDFNGALLELTVSGAATEPGTVSFILRGADREQVKSELLTLVKKITF